LNFFSCIFLLNLPNALPVSLLAQNLQRPS
jgi:hypothetical protein